MTDERPTAGASRLVALYPRAWRTRYETEFLAVLADRPATSLADRLDIVRGALDAHLHPEERSAVPPVSAVFGGGMWVLVAASIIALPAPPNWPGYLLETVPLALAGVIALGVAIVGCWLRLDRSGDRSVRKVGAAGVGIAVVGHVLWSLALLASWAGVGYGAPVAVASTMGGVGTLVVGLALVRAADWPIAGLLDRTGGARGASLVGLARTAVSGVWPGLDRDRARRTRRSGSNTRSNGAGGLSPRRTGRGDGAPSVTCCRGELVQTYTPEDDHHRLECPGPERSRVPHRARCAR